MSRRASETESHYHIMVIFQSDGEKQFGGLG